MLIFADAAKPFSHIAMDLITGLPNSKGYNAILTIVDHGCSRGTIFLPCTMTITGPQSPNSISIIYINGLEYPNESSATEIHDLHPTLATHLQKN